MLKPYKIFFLLSLILFLVSLPSFFFPEGGIKFCNISLHYPSINQIFEIDTSRNQNQPSLKPEIAFLDRMVDSTLKTKSLQNQPLNPNKNIDSTSIQDSSKIVDTIPNKSFSTDYLKSKINKLEFPDSTNNPLSSFFEALHTGECNRKLIRVLHYGDSQIEGDRITSYLRSRLQSKFGGGGLGLLHAVPQSSQPAAIIQSTSSNWEKTTLADYDKALTGTNRLGALEGYSIYTPSHNLFSNLTDEAWVLFQRTGGISSAHNFQKLRLFYGFNSKPFMIELKSKEKTLDAEIIPSTNKLNSLTLDIASSLNSFEIKFKGEDSPMIFGISLESEKGVNIDNIPIRGSSGTNFTKTNMVFMKEMLKMLNTKLIILQFGVNVVPNIVESYKYYEIQLYNQIKAIQAAKPDASIIMIGVSDVSRKEGLRFVSYPNVEKIRDAQKNASFKAGIPFWDCYKAMGGKNSMVAWENSKPPLATKDFIHFTYRGANLIAEMFYGALMLEYDNYILKISKQKINQFVSREDSLKLSFKMN